MREHKIELIIAKFEEFFLDPYVFIAIITAEFILLVRYSWNGFGRGKSLRNLVAEALFFPLVLFIMAMFLSEETRLYLAPLSLVISWIGLEPTMYVISKFIVSKLPKGIQGEANKAVDCKPSTLSPSQNKTSKDKPEAHTEENKRNNS